MAPLAAQHWHAKLGSVEKPTSVGSEGEKKTQLERGFPQFYSAIRSNLTGSPYIPCHEAVEAAFRDARPLELARSGRISRCPKPS